AVKPDGVAVLAGIIPLKSEKSGPWLNANLPGVVAPPDMLEAMDDAAKQGRTRERGIELAAEVIRDMKRICQGVHVMAIGGEAEEVVGLQRLSPDVEDLTQGELTRCGRFDVDLAGLVVRVDRVEAMAPRGLRNDADLTRYGNLLSVEEHRNVRMHVIGLAGV